MTSKQALGLTMNELAEANAEHVTTISKLEQKLTDMAVQLANAESKCRELAAENAGLKNALEWLYETVSSESVSVPDEKYSSVTNAAQVLSETQVTDSFLAEVRASELDSLAGVAETMLVKFANQGISDHPESKGWEMIFKQASQRAAQLRKGVQS